MSQENVEVVCRYLARISQAMPNEMVGHIAEFWDPSGDFYPAGKFPESRPCHGREEIARFVAEFRGVWDAVEYEIKEAFAVGDDRVLALGRMTAEGAESGVALEGEVYSCAWLRCGRLIRMEDHLTPGGALRSLGLEGDSIEAAGLRG